MRALVFLIIIFSVSASAEFYNLSPNMSLPIPQVGVESGPQWATDINNALTLIDGHNHSPGYGVQIPTNGIDLNANLSFNNFSATSLQACVFSPQGSYTSTDSLFVNGVDLYYRDGNNNLVRMTVGGSVNAGSGAISGLTAPASASYNSGSTSFVWQSDTNTAANMDAGSYILRDLTPGSHGITLSPPNSLAGDYTMTLPTALPASTLPLFMTSGGALNTTGTVPVPSGGTGATTFTSQCGLEGNGASAINCASNILFNQHADHGDIQFSGDNNLIGGVSNSYPSWGRSSGNLYLASAGACVEMGAEGGASMRACNSGSGIFTHGGFVVGDSNAANSPAFYYEVDDSVGLTATNAPLKLAVNHTGTDVQDFSNNTTESCLPSNNSCFPHVVSATPSTNGLMIVRGIAVFNGSSWRVNAGEGWSVTSGNSTGLIIAFTTPFQDTPAVTANVGGSGLYVNLSFGYPTSSAASFALSGTAAPSDTINFIAIGQRNSSN